MLTALAVAGAAVLDSHASALLPSDSQTGPRLGWSYVANSNLPRGRSVPGMCTDAAGRMMVFGGAVCASFEDVPH